MDLSNLVGQMLTKPDQLIGAESILVGPETTMEVDLEETRRLRGPFCRAVASIPNIEDGLSHKLIAPYVGGSTRLALGVIAIGQVLELWRVFPDPEAAPDLYGTPGSMFPGTSPIEHWPEWSGVVGGGDSFPKVAGEPEDVDDLDEGEKSKFLGLFG